MTTPHPPVDAAQPSVVPQPTDQIQHKSTPPQMPCPACGHAMPDLKGGKASICPNCGFKDSCCY